MPARSPGTRGSAAELPARAGLQRVAADLEPGSTVVHRGSRARPGVEVLAVQFVGDAVLEGGGLGLHYISGLVGLLLHAGIVLDPQDQGADLLVALTAGARAENVSGS